MRINKDDDTICYTRRESVRIVDMAQDAAYRHLEDKELYKLFRLLDQFAYSYVAKNGVDLTKDPLPEPPLVDADGDEIYICG